MPIPIYTNSGPSGPWTETDTKISIAITIISLGLLLIPVLIRIINGYKRSEIFDIDGGNIALDIIYMIGAVSSFICIVSWIGAGIYQLL